MKTIVAPTDFSPVARNAVNYALDMATLIDAQIVLLNTFTLPASYSETSVWHVTTVTIDDIKQSSEMQLNTLKDELVSISEGQVKIYTEARIGNTVDVLEDICSTLKPFAIVMGSHGTSGVERLIMGSTTLSAIRNLRHPVIVVPPGTQYKQIRKIGLACDFTDVVETIPADYIKNIVKEFDAELFVLNVNEEGESYDAETPLESAWLDTLLGDIKPDYYFLKREDVVQGINEFSETHNLDVVIVIPKKRKLLERIFHKSRSKELVKHAHIPVLSIH